MFRSENFQPAYRDPGWKNRARSREPSKPALSYEHIENFTKDLEARRDLWNRAHVKRRQVKGWPKKTNSPIDLWLTRRFSLVFLHFQLKREKSPPERNDQISGNAPPKALRGKARNASDCWPGARDHGKEEEETRLFSPSRLPLRAIFHWVRERRMGTRQTQASFWALSRVSTAWRLRHGLPSYHFQWRHGL